MRMKNLAFSAIAFMIISQIIYTAGAFADMGYYADPAYAAVWSRLMMPSSGAPPAEFFLLTIMANLIMGAIFAYGYSLVVKAFTKDRAFQAEKPWKTGAKYGFFVFAINAMGVLTLPMLVNVPFALAFSWAVQSLVALPLAGAATGIVVGRK
jgi:hypothetical protein